MLFGSVTGYSPGTKARVAPTGPGGVGLRGPREPGGSGRGRDRLRALDTMLIFECYGEDVAAVPGTPVLFPSPHDFPPRPPPKERLVEQLVRARALGPPRGAPRGLRAGSHAVVASMASGAALPSPTAASQRNSASERVESPRTPAAPRHLRELPSGTRRRANETTPQGPLWLPLARRVNVFIDRCYKGRRPNATKRSLKLGNLFHTKIKTKGHSGPQRLGGALLR